MAMGDDRSGAPVWDDSAVTRAEAAAFFARVIGSDSRYISHGEVQCGLSEDGKSWVGDLDARFAEDMAEDDPERDLLVMRDEAGLIVAAAIAYWVASPRVRYGIIEDMAVDPAQRSAGLGSIMVAEIEQRARDRQCRWLFLESGKDNERAHGFFESSGFAMLSHTFSKKL